MEKIKKPLLIANKTQFDKASVAKMKFEDFKKTYETMFNCSRVDLKKLFTDNGGKI